MHLNSNVQQKLVQYTVRKNYYVLVLHTYIYIYSN